MATRKKAADRRARPRPSSCARRCFAPCSASGKGSKGRQRLQMVADALVDAAIKGEMAALREVFQRIDGKTLRRPERRGGEGPG